MKIQTAKQFVLRCLYSWLESDFGIGKNKLYETSSKFPNHPEEYLGGSVRVEKGPFKGLFLVFDGVGWVETKCAL